MEVALIGPMRIDGVPRVFLVFQPQFAHDTPLLATHP